MNDFADTPILALAAQALAAELRAAGLAARVEPAIVNCRIHVSSVGDRDIRLLCVLDLYTVRDPLSGRRRNPFSRRDERTATVSGPVYRVTLYEHGREIAHRGTHVASHVVACARSWLAGAALEDLEAPFADRELRKRSALSALGKQLDPQLRWQLEGDKLTVYSDERSCCLASEDDGLACSFRCKYGQVASAAIDDPVTAISAWLVAHVPVNELAKAVRGLELAPHVDVLQVDPARWRWLNLRDSHRDEWLCPSLTSLVEVLAASPIVTRFYPYTSAFRLCLSASSHYPWVDDGLPVVTPADPQYPFEDPQLANRLVVRAQGDGTYRIGAERCDRARSKELIEQALAASPLRPFFGSKHDDNPEYR